MVCCDRGFLWNEWKDGFVTWCRIFALAAKRYDGHGLLLTWSDFELISVGHCFSFGSLCSTQAGSRTLAILLHV